MPGTGGRDYYVITVRGERGPLDRADLRALLAGKEINGGDQVRSAFGRSLGTVAQVLTVPSDRRDMLSARGAEPAEQHRKAARPANPVAIIAILLLAMAALAIWLFATPAQPIPPTVTPSAPVEQAAPPGMQPTVRPKVRLPIASRAVPIAPGQISARGPTPPEQADESAAHAADGSLTSKWFDMIGDRDANGRLSWICYGTGPHRAVAYMLASANDAPERNPSAWRLIGISADGHERILDARIGETFSAFFQRRVFAIAWPGDYAAYRLDITDVHPGSNGVQLSEFALYASPSPILRGDGLPAGWSTVSIGNDASPPPAFDAGTWTVHGGGRDIWGIGDQFRLVHATVPEEVTITTCLCSANGQDAWSKAGVMLRASTDPGSPFAMLLVLPDNRLQFIYRQIQSAPATGQTLEAVSLPVWLRLVRKDSSLTAQVSGNGRQWRDSGSIVLTGCNGPLLAGLGVCSKQEGRPMTACFDGVELTVP